jgi:hypothetical protein
LLPPTPPTHFAVDDLTPFGENLGQANTTYAAFSATVANASVFDLPWNYETCPKAKNCNQDTARQMYRLATNQKQMFRVAYYAAKAERANAKRSL